LRVGFPFSSFIAPGIPLILAQNDLRRAAAFFVFGCGAGAFNPGLSGLAALYEALPLAFNPPDFDLPSALVQAGVLAIICTLLFSLQ
jgi:hypothetical protein